MKEEIISFLWFELDILGVFGKDVFLRATINNKECIMNYGIM
jgi:hypothetical protein